MKIWLWLWPLCGGAYSEVKGDIIIIVGVVVNVYLYRGVYCGLVSAVLTNILCPELTENTSKWLVSCQTYEVRTYYPGTYYEAGIFNYDKI